MPKKRMFCHIVPQTYQKKRAKGDFYSNDIGGHIADDLSNKDCLNQMLKTLKET